MLRHYDEIGLLNPIQTDPGTGYRYYGEEQLYVINKITSLKDMGFGLTEIIMAAVAQWVKDSGYEFDGPAFNIYHVSPHETSDPNEFVTEVCYPVKKK